VTDTRKTTVKTGTKRHKHGKRPGPRPVDPNAPPPVPKVFPEGSRAKHLESRQWLPGQSGNPHGGRIHNPILRALKAMTRTEVAEIGTLLVELDLGALERIAVSRTEPALRVWFATIAVNAIKKKDFFAFDGLLNRIIGKVPDRNEITGAAGGPIDARQMILTRDERLAEIERLRMERELVGED
jgi:hypothetical protein